MGCSSDTLKVQELNHMNQLSFSDIKYSNRQRKTKREAFLDPIFLNVMGIVVIE